MNCTRRTQSWIKVEQQILLKDLSSSGPSFFFCRSETTRDHGKYIETNTTYHAQLCVRSCPGQVRPDGVDYSPRRGERVCEVERRRAVVARKGERNYEEAHRVTPRSATSMTRLIRRGRRRRGRGQCGKSRGGGRVEVHCRALFVKGTWTREIVKLKDGYNVLETKG